MVVNTYKDLPYTIELDWRTGNVLLNIHVIDCKLVVSEKDADTIKRCVDLYKSEGGLPLIKQGDIYKNQSSIVKVIDITSENYGDHSKETEDTRCGFILLDYIYLDSSCDEGIFVITEDNEIFIRQKDNNKLILEKMVIFIDIEFDNPKYHAMPYSNFINLYTSSLISRKLDY